MRRRPEPRPHRYQNDPEWPGTCVRCHLADPHRRNAIHQAPDIAEVIAETRRRVGDSEDDE